MTWICPAISPSSTNCPHLGGPAGSRQRCPAGLHHCNCTHLQVVYSCLLVPGRLCVPTGYAAHAVACCDCRERRREVAASRRL